MYAFGVVIGIIVSAGMDFRLDHLFLGVSTALFCQASAFALNDYVDYDVDVANERMDRPLVRGDLSRKTALLIALVLAPLGILSAYLISFDAFLLAFAITMLGYAYDLKLKEYGILGNLYIALSMCIPFIFGSVVAMNFITPQVAVLSVIAFLSGVAREIMKGIEDVEGDALRNVRTIARVWGIERASKLSTLLFITAVAMSFYPFFFVRGYEFDLKYIVPVLITDVILLKVSFELIKRHGRDDIRRYRKETLIALAVGLVGFLLGAF